ncbi:DUF1566 domain-containing protein [Thiorhodospira sibirica]|uniref:Lcl C-terminal domain-containing protein n=1 Tax=Thiorhodospira sibirica TaxID=154347 RepID=UPI00131F2F61|nr:DUF1566 domain-containing protein [Thiorhodospira sibirica]
MLGIVLMVLITLPAAVLADVICMRQDPSVPITTPTTDFILHENGVATHTKTGLMWMRCSLGQIWDNNTCIGDASTYTWVGALQTAQNTEFAGYTDWRLPNRRELMSIVERSCIPSANITVFPNTASTAFWSSSPYARDGGYAWHVTFNAGYVNYESIDNNRSVRLVRTPDSSPDDDLIAGRYLPIEDGSIIRDITTDLEWQRCSVGQTWNSAQQSCDGEAGRFTWDDAIALTPPGGFRLPNRTELRSLVYCSTGLPQEFGMEADFTFCSGGYHRPTIVEQAFPNTPSSWFWSSSPNAYNSGHAWCVGFDNGPVSHYYKYYAYRVRLVRARQ